MKIGICAKIRAHPPIVARGLTPLRRSRAVFSRWRVCGSSLCFSASFSNSGLRARFTAAILAIVACCRRDGRNSTSLTKTVSMMMFRPQMGMYRWKKPSRVCITFVKKMTTSVK